MVTDIFANHAHVFPESINPNGTLDRLTRLMDACGIPKAVCFPPFPHAWDRTDLDPNHWLAEELRSRDRLVGFGTLDLRLGDPADQVGRVVDLGFRGLKLHPQAQNFAIASPEAFAAYEQAERHDLFVTFHTGIHAHRLKGMHPLDFDEVAHHFPKLRFSMEHVGGYSFFNQALAVLASNVPAPWQTDKRPHVFAGLTSVFTTHMNRFWHLSDEQLVEVIAQIGASNCIFGLDFPYNLERETEMAFATLARLGLSPADSGAILGGNLRRELSMG